jgi:molybdenum cofactor cytidylyltransferase
LEALVLAAGAGSRFGGGKLLTPWRDGVLLDGALGAAFAAPARTVSVVWGADDGVQDAARAYADKAGASDRLRLIHASGYAAGLSASLIAGIAAMPADAEGAFVFLGDMPRVPRAVLEPLAQALGEGAEAAAPVFEGQRGHPVLFSAALFPQMLNLAGDQGAGGLLRALGEAVVRVAAADDGVLYDVDRREDLEA